MQISRPNVLLSLLTLCAWVNAANESGARDPALGRLEESFNEEMGMEVLANGDVLVTFMMEQRAMRRRHLWSFPLAIKSLVDAIDFYALEMHFVQGHWDEHRWGAPSLTPHPHGGEFIVWVDKEAHVREIWSNLTFALSGLFCASLNSVRRGDQMIESPLMEECLVGRPCKRLHAFLQKEPVCVENLTPWLKLTPCKGKKGLISIFEPQNFFNGVYHGLHTRIERVSPVEGQQQTLVLTQNLEVIFRSEMMKSLVGAENRFQSKTFSPCPLATTAAIHVHRDTPVIVKDVHRSGEEVSSVHDTGGDHYQRIFHLSPFGQYALRWNEKSDCGLPEKRIQDTISGMSFLEKSKGDRGTYILQLDRPSPAVDSDDSLHRLCLLQSFPWTIRIWLHSLQLWMNQKELPLDASIVSMEFQVADDRRASTVVHLCIDITNSVNSLTLSLDYTKAFLFLEEHPPDAYRGVDIPPTLLQQFSKVNATTVAKFSPKKKEVIFFI